MLRLAIKTFGCRANTLDTDVLFLEAKRRGFHVVSETEPADAYIINTCTVTENADRDARHQAHRFKKLNQGALVAMVGCYAQVAHEEIEKFPEVDFIVGTANKLKALDLIARAHTSPTDIVEKDHVGEADGFLTEYFPGSRQARANIKIQDGCNYKCSFCIIPEARGRSRSLPLEGVVSQVRQASAEGFKEIVLTGIHLAHYGWDQGTSLTELVQTLVKIPRGPRIRISTLDPFEIPDEIIEMLGREEKLCPHFHIAIQSGSDRILEKMKRIYRAHEFNDICDKIYARYSDTFIGVDVIVGFPGEGETEFMDTVQSLKDAYWSKLHVFSFSPRPGTRAAEMPDPVTPQAIAARSERLRCMSTKRYGEFLETQIGKQKLAILERTSRARSAVWHGHTENYVPVLIECRGEAKELLPVQLEKVDGEKLWATPKPILSQGIAHVGSLSSDLSN